MPNTQPSRANDKNKSASRAAPAARATESRAAPTGERDESYNLVSVLYHALQGADTIRQYERDAQGDDELRTFFQNVRKSYAQIAQRAKVLLADQLDEDAPDEEDDEEEDDDAGESGAAEDDGQ